MPTAARQKYLAKQAAKKSDLLSDADRQAEYDKVMTQLSQISAPEVDKFEAMMSEWVKDGRVRQGVIPVPSIRRAIVYSLGISRSKTFVSLRSDNPDEYTDTNTTMSEPVRHATSAPESTVDEAEDELPELVPSATAVTESESVPSTEPVSVSSTEPVSVPSTEPASVPSTEPVSVPSITKPKHEKTNEKSKKKKQTFAQPAPRGSRHASRPPIMKLKAQSA